MNDTKQIPLVISEMAGIWNSYVNDTLARCVFKYFLSNIEDNETKNLLNQALNLSEQHINKLKDFFNMEGIPVPVGFSDSDVDINAPRLFTDSFYLLYLSHMSGFGMEAYSLILRYTSD